AQAQAPFAFGQIAQLYRHALKPPSPSAQRSGQRLEKGAGRFFMGASATKSWFPASAIVDVTKSHNRSGD
ncbi:MAG: hypothetical protein NTZ64_13170, partial [Polaromonas sp.]|nr:hypothetical protein [Polaromonas sp.]